jgi:GNAT superfamily N-acetyltransferase
MLACASVRECHSTKSSTWLGKRSPDKVESLSEVGELLAAYDAQLRGHLHDRLPDSLRVERDGPLVRTLRLGKRGFVEYRDLAGLDGEELDTLIARQVQVFARHGEPFEWKLHGHDRPADLPDRLRAAGLVPEDTETVVIGPVEVIAGEPSLPEGVVIRELREPGDFERLVQLDEAMSHEDHSWIDDLAAERAADPQGLGIFVAEAGGRTVCDGWMRFPSGTEFATFWGGFTLPAWRRRGVYRALVAHRAKVAVARGRRYIAVDASDDSRPILERLGFIAVTTTTPYVWSPGRATDS